MPGSFDEPEDIGMGWEIRLVQIGTLTLSCLHRLMNGRQNEQEAKTDLSVEL